MRVYGLTGGIASGKSLVTGMLRGLGAEVQDADAIYHALLAPQDGVPSPLVRQITARFAGVVLPDGSLDRKALGARVFGDAAELAALGEITHPAIYAEFLRRTEALRQTGCARAFYDAPLLFERGLERGLDGVVVVWVPRAVQLARLRLRDHIDDAAAERKLASQWPLDDKRARATWVIDNSGSQSDTERQVVALWQALQQDRA
jgi:dephospho-CoA kinase